MKKKMFQRGILDEGFWNQKLVECGLAGVLFTGTILFYNVARGWLTN